MTICNIKLSLIKIKINKIKLLTGFFQNWVLLSIHENIFKLFNQITFLWYSVVKRRTREIMEV
jgi:hypothetical protein